MPKMNVPGVCLAWLLMGLLPTLAAAADCDPWVAKLLSGEGSVEVKPYRADRWQQSTPGQHYCFGDRIRVGAASRASVELNNDTILRLDERSTLVLPDPVDDGFSFVELLEGALHLISRVRGRLEIRTPFVNAGLEGTEFVVRVGDDETIVSVIEGRVAVHNRHGRLTLNGGQTASAQSGAAPVLRVDLKPADTVHWALYYPLSIDPNTGTTSNRMEEAHRLLRLGRLDAAQDSIDAMLVDHPGDSDATALASVIALAQNRKDDALQLAQRAVDNGPTAAALLALSYAQQAHFRLQQALSTIHRATASYGDQALLWSRLAELQASLGQHAPALQSAQRAVDLDPDLSRTQSVLGFAHLSAADPDSAQVAFDRAIALDSADPLPRLGRGLVDIRKGELARGRREMEIAVSLDPANSLVRSYLGKAYAQEGRDKEAATEFALARQLDPLDPTPWLYDALRKQADNRPVEAIRDFEQSARLNANRAVYRSQLLLDGDLAVRNAAIGMAYASLGLRDLGRRRAIESLSTDPDNATAHALLADSERGVPRHGLTRMSEQLQAQLLQPLTSRPYAPSDLIRERDPGSGLMPPAAGANEFSSLFDREGPRFTVSGIVGDNDSEGFELLHSQLLGNTSYSVGYAEFDTDGFRPGADANVETYNGFVQVAVSDRLDVQFEARHQDKEQGDLRLGFDPRFSVVPERRHLDYDLFRIGARSALDGATTLLFSLAYADREEDETKTDVIGTTVVENEENAWLLEAQIRRDADSWKVIAGGGMRETDFRYDEVLVPAPLPFPFPPVPPLQIALGTDMIRSSNVYLYVDWTAMDNLVWTFGIAHDDHSDDNRGNQIDYSRWNPKFGVQWQARPWLNIRAAHFRTTKHQLVAEQTIEPAQIAGFAQFFDDFNLSKATQNSVAADLKFSPDYSGSLEFSRRNNREKKSLGSLVEKNFRATISATLNDQWTATLEYHYQEDDRLHVNPFLLRTDSIPLQLTYHHPGGFFGSLDWTRFEQDWRVPSAENIHTRFDAVNLTGGFQWNRGKSRVTVGVNDLLDDIGVYRDDRHKTNDKLSVYRPFLPGRAFWANIELAWD